MIPISFRLVLLSAVPVTALVLAAGPHRTGNVAAPGAGAASQPPAGVAISLSPPTQGRSLTTLLGVNIGPLPTGEPGNVDLTNAYRTAGVTLIRTHDYYGPLDMATIYPDQRADPADPASYDFAASDRVFAAILAGGFEPYLRLGDSYNNAPGYPRAAPRRPINPEHWSRAAVAVVRHYQAMAEAAGRPLRYVEIWNEPDNRQFWDGSPAEFAGLFARTAIAVKAAFPDLSVGGPGLTPAGAKTARGQAYTRDLLDRLRDNGAPLDFFSWHMYANDPSDFFTAAVFYRTALDSAGFGAAESHVTEWNTEHQPRRGADDTSVRISGRASAILTAAWIELVQQGVALAAFYRGPDPSSNAPTFYGMFYADGRPKPAALALALWSELARYPLAITAAQAEAGAAGPLRLLARGDSGGQIALLIANPSDQSVAWRLALPELETGAIVTLKEIDAAAIPRTITTADTAGTIGPWAVQLLIIGGPGPMGRPSPEQPGAE
jgi:xylan 1,4-beta-xylosidase